MIRAAPDRITKIAYNTRAEATAARTKQHEVYLFPNCDAHHRATKRRSLKAEQLLAAYWSSTAVSRTGASARCPCAGFKSWLMNCGEFARVRESSFCKRECCFWCTETGFLLRKSLEPLVTCLRAAKDPDFNLSARLFPNDVYFINRFFFRLADPNGRVNNFGKLKSLFCETDDLVMGSCAIGRRLPDKLRRTPGT